MKPLNSPIKPSLINNNLACRDAAADFKRQPYIPPRVKVIHPIIQGGSTTELSETNLGLWSS